jgi:hypothetical protein
MLIPGQQGNELLPCDSSRPWLSFLLSHDLELDLKQLDISESPEYRQHDEFRTGTPFESEPSDSDCSSDSGDDLLFEVVANPSSTVLDSLSSRDVLHFDWEGTEVPAIRQSNALNLVCMLDDVDLEAQTVATFDTQVESLRTPPIHQGARSIERPNQKNQERHEHLVPQFESSANELLVGGCPQDICLRADVSDASGLKVSRHTAEKPFQSINRAYQRFQGCQRADADPEPHKPHSDDDMEDGSNIGHPGRPEAVAAVERVSMHAMGAPPNDSEPLRAPRMRPIPLPKEDMGRRSNGTLEVISKALVLVLARLDRCAETIGRRTGSGYMAVYNFVKFKLL